MQTTVVELDDDLAERLSALAQREGSTVARLLEDFARRMADAAVPGHAASPTKPTAPHTVGSPTNRVTLEDVRQAVEEADLEWATRQITLAGGTVRADAGR
jgi:hypothetical protein